MLACCVLLPEIAGQENPPGDVKQIWVAPLNGLRGGARVAAQSIERGARYPSIVHLKGKVEVRANGYILTADEADYNEETGEVEASGKVTVRPYPPLPGFAPRATPR